MGVGRYYIWTVEVVRYGWRFGWGSDGPVDRASRDELDSTGRYERRRMMMHSWRNGRAGRYTEGARAQRMYVAKVLRKISRYWRAVWPSAGWPCPRSREGMEAVSNRVGIERCRSRWRCRERVVVAPVGDGPDGGGAMCVSRQGKVHAAAAAAPHRKT